MYVCKKSEALAKNRVRFVLFEFQNDAEDRVRRLEADKESLQLQVQVLSEQIAAQTEKMVDLERSLNDTRQKLDDTEQRLQKVSWFWLICFVPSYPF